MLTLAVNSDQPILFGPKRLRAVPCRLTDLKIDIVLVTHNHPDHLGISTRFLFDFYPPIKLAKP